MLRLVDCSLLSPPQAGRDGRSPYQMLETLRAYGSGLLAGAGELEEAAATLAGYAVEVAEQAAAGLQTSGAEEAQAAWRLDAEDATMRQVLAWALDRDPDTAVRLAAALGWWWLLRGRLPSRYGLLREVAHAPRRAATAGAGSSCGWHSPRTSAPTTPVRWSMKPRCATRPQTGGRPRCWLTAWPCGR